MDADRHRGSLPAADPGRMVPVHRDRLHRLSRNNALALHRRELPRQEQAEERLRQPLLPLRRDGTARLRDRHPVFPRRRTSRRTSSTASSSTAARWHCSFTRSPSRFSASKNKPKNVFDSLFFHCGAMALLVYAIAIPFFRVDYTSLPLTVGILAGLMWVPLSWIIQHWVGIFHAVARTVLVTAAWYLAPHHRFVVIPAVIVGVYGVTIVILEQRWRTVSRSTAAAATACIT